ncbi:uncharacterized protein LOC128960485 [Oppia nitens]|uniref:uncharacterized protein LOC128960485 n=1 Tax=Oppia nitens TaxID=1686743 RepID=UPI0023DB4542|nr:uncharacterized protein LOC128960485 [Oppia nitens]
MANKNKRIYLSATDMTAEDQISMKYMDYDEDHQLKHNTTENNYNNEENSEKNNEVNGSVGTVLSEQLSSINMNDIKKDFSYYHMIRRILYPFALTGAPIFYCLKDPDKTIKFLSRYGLTNIYSFCMVFFVHSICIYCLVRVGFHIFQLGTINDQLWDEILAFIYSLSGVLALDLIWIYRITLRKLINSLDKTPELDQTILLNYKYFKLKYRIKLIILTIFVLLLMLLSFTYIAIVIVVAINTHSSTVWTDKVFTFMAIYSLYVVLFVMVLYVALCWIMKFKFQHLNFYIETLIKRKCKPELSHLEIIKIWYRDNMSDVSKIDEIFNIFIFGYFVLLFFGIVVEIEEVLRHFKEDNLKNGLFACAFVAIMMFSLFYTIKQTADVNENSMNTKNLLYKYVLSTKPEDRTAIYYEEFQLMVPGLLSKYANFSLLGLIYLDYDFMAKAVVFLYTYAILFKQFASETTNSLDSSVKNY